MCNDLTLKPLVQHFYTLILHVTPTILHVNVEHPLYDTGQVSLGIPGYPLQNLGYPCLNWKSPWQEDTRPGKGIPGDTRSEKGIPCLRRGYHAWEGDTMSEKGIPCLRRGYHWIFKPFRFVCKMKSRWDFLPLPFPNRQMSHYKLFLFLKASLMLHSNHIVVYHYFQK